MLFNIKSIIAFTYVVIAYQSNATPILNIDKTDIPRLEKRTVIPAPSPITFSSMGRASTHSKTVATTNNVSSTATTRNTAVGSNETGSRIVAKTTNTEGGAGQEGTMNTVNRVPSTQSTSSTTNRTTIGRNTGGTINSSTLNLPTNLELNNHVSALPFNQIDNVKEQVGLYRRSPSNGIYTSNFIRNRVDISTRAKGRLASASSDFRKGNVGLAVGHLVSGTIASHPRMQSLIAHGRATRQAYQSQAKRK